MSRDYISDPDQSNAFANIAIRDALERIADTLDDYMEMSLAGQEVLMAAKSIDPAAFAQLEPIYATLIEVLGSIRKRRSER